jgi:sugar O-acyltransferase (sialic acid O-acetyltransferase NeuD family)
MKRPRGEIHILGTGVLAEEFFALAQDMGIGVAAFVENEDKSKDGGTLCDRPILWVDRLPQGAECLCALSTTTRSRFIEQVQGRAEFVNMVHPSSVILPGTTLGEGTVVSSGVLIASHTRIGRHVFINRGARIGHHTRIGDIVTIQPGANIGGLIEIDDSVYIGMSATVIERRKIGTGVTVAAGSVVIRDVPDRVMVAGNPAVVKREIAGAK